MRRVTIVGNGGSGKSWLATRLAGALGLPLHHVDEAALHDDWRSRGLRERIEIEETWTGRSAWVIDGTGLATLPVRVGRADTVIVLETPAWRCLTRVIHRRLRRRGPARPGVIGAERLRPRYLLYVVTYHRRHAPRVRAVLARSSARVVRLRDQADVERFLDALAPR